MQGTVTKINSERSIVAIETDAHGYTIIELISDFAIEIGDVMRWPEYQLGGATFFNVTKAKTMPVYVRNPLVGPERLRQQLLID